MTFVTYGISDQLEIFIATRKRYSRNKLFLFKFEHLLKNVVFYYFKHIRCNKNKNNLVTFVHTVIDKLPKLLNFV